MSKSKLALLVLAVALWLASSVPAGAHTEVLESDPAAGGTAPTGQNEVTITFAALDPEVAAEIDVVGSDGESIVAGSPTVIEGTAAAGTTVAVPVEPLEEGRHEVTWEVVSDDGDPSSGSFEFTAEGSDDSGGLWLLWAAALAIPVAFAVAWLRRRLRGAER